MAKSVLDIVIKTVKQGGGDKETVKGLVDLKAGVSQATAVFAALAGAAYLVDKALDATAGKAVAYANKVENLSNATGMNAEASSRTIQVLDDLRISYETLEASVKKNADTTDFSIDGLSRLSAEYLALTTQTEKQAFAQQHFGKQWVDFVKVLESGPEKLQAMNGAVQANLILTEKSIQASREYQENLDNLNDKFEGILVNVGNNVIPTFNNMLDSVDRMSTMTRQQSMALVYLDDALSKGKITTEEYSAAVEKLKIPLDASEAALQNNSDAVQELTIDYAAQLSMIERVSKASAKQIKEIAYNNLVAKLSVDGLTAAEKKVAEEAGKALGIFNDASIKNASSIEALTKRFMEGKISVEQFNAELTKIEREINVVVTMSQVGLTVAGTGQGFCFIAGTMISMADGSFKPIEAVNAGDVVLSYNTETGEILSATVEGTYQHAAEQMENGYLLINGRIGVTDNHPLYINGQWANAGTLKVHDLLKTIYGDLSVEIIEQVDEQVPTFNLHIDHDSHNYFADGILAHNKASGGLAYGPGDGSSDTFAAMLANGEFVVNARAVREPGMLDLLNAINSGKSVKNAGGGGSRPVYIYGGVQIVANRNVNDILAELSG